MNEFPALVRRTEARAKELGLSVPELCRRAKVNRATWQRWKAGKNWPNTKRWAAIEAVIAKVV